MAQSFSRVVKSPAIGNTGNEAILRRFIRNNRQHPTFQALAESGKTEKAVFPYQSLRSERLRRDIYEVTCPHCFIQQQ